MTARLNPAILGLSASNLLQEAFLDVPSCHVNPGKAYFGTWLSNGIKVPQ